MNGFRIAILSLMVLVVALLFYFVIAMLPNQQRAFEDYNRTKATNALVTNAETASEVQEDSDSAAALEKLRAESRQAEDRVHANEEHRTIAQAEEQQRRESEQAMAEELARESAEAAALGMVTEVALDAGFFSFKPLGDPQISEGLVVALRRGSDEYIICEAVVTRFYEESGEFIADIKTDSFSTPQKGDIERPKPAKGDLVILTPFDTADELRKKSMEDIPAGL
ncbi:MAG: hypothetical protein IJ993_03145 [Akkermansia sp.]|nr:hypothetical protein [Akkermansia sp.]MBR3695216.1 hypothetical protein [Akkermansia sp.]